MKVRDFHDGRASEERRRHWLLAVIQLQMKLPAILPAQPVMHSAAMLALATTLVATPFPAHAARTIGEIQGSGLVFKDTLKVEAFSDPKVSGVQLYLSDFQRPAAEKLAKGDLVRSRLLWRPAPPAATASLGAAPVSRTAPLAAPRLLARLALRLTRP